MDQKGSDFGPQSKKDRPHSKTEVREGPYRAKSVEELTSEFPGIQLLRRNSHRY
jgi:hypothetical protein